MKPNEASYKIYQVDAFTDTLFKGNPACVVPLKEWLPDELLLKIAKENAVAETAYFIEHKNHFHLRWFTPDIEMDLCGHATLAAAHIIKSELNSADDIKFKTLSGDLSVRCKEDLYDLNLPSRKPVSAELPHEIKSALNIQPEYIFKSRDYLLVYNKEQDIKALKIDQSSFNKINLGHGGVIATAKGDDVDFVSRFFTPQATILEDPVTGSAHCSLIPYWAPIFSKNKFIAHQCSERGGTLYCEDKGNRVIVGGKAITYSKGVFRI